MRFLLLSSLTNTSIQCKDTGTSVLLSLYLHPNKYISSIHAAYNKKLSYLDAATFLQFIHASCTPDFIKDECIIDGMHLITQEYDDTYRQISFLLEEGSLQFSSFYPTYIGNSVAKEGANYFLKKMASSPQLLLFPGSYVSSSI